MLIVIKLQQDIGINSRRSLGNVLNKFLVLWYSKKMFQFVACQVIVGKMNETMYLCAQ